MDSPNSDESDDSSNSYSSSSTDMLTLTIRTSYIRTVHRAVQAYLHQMTTSSIHQGIFSTKSLASSVTEQDILYAYIWHLLTRARIGGGVSSSSQERDRDDSSTSDYDCTEVARLFTTFDLAHGVSTQALVTVPVRSFFLRPDLTDETGVPHLRQYALLAREIRSAIDETVGSHFLMPHKGQAHEVASRVRIMVKKDCGVGAQTGLHIISLDNTGGKIPNERWGKDWYRQERREIGSDLSSMYSSWDEQTEMGVRTAYKPLTRASGECHAVVWSESEGSRRAGRWRVQLHLHPLDRQWLRRTVEEYPREVEIWPRV